MEYSEIFGDEQATQEYFCIIVKLDGVAVVDTSQSLSHRVLEA